MPTHFLSVDDFSNIDYENIFRDAANIKKLWKKERGFSLSSRRILRDFRRYKTFTSGRGSRVALLFAQPSTRTSMSFDKATQALGCEVPDLNYQHSSIAKGESYKDTASMAALAMDVLVARHGGAGGTLRSLAHGFQAHSGLKDVAIINAGEGTDEHPTQALLDIFTIDEQLGRRDVHIGLYGDLKQGRTVHSLIKLAARFGARFSCITPDPDLQISQDYVTQLQGSSVSIQFVSDIDKVIGDLDVLYATRLQRESLSDEMLVRYDRRETPYQVTPDLLQKLPANAIVMHPLPRADELTVECDIDPRSKYITQAENGIYTRAALLRHCLALR